MKKTRFPHFASNYTQLKKCWIYRKVLEIKSIGITMNCWNIRFEFLVVSVRIRPNFMKLYHKFRFHARTRLFKDYFLKTTFQKTHFKNYFFKKHYTSRLQQSSSFFYQESFYLFGLKLSGRRSNKYRVECAIKMCI